MALQKGSNKMTSKNKFLKIFFFYLFGSALHSLAISADIEIRPPSSGAFSVKSADGTSVRFKVNEDGTIKIQRLVSGASNDPLCWNSSSGILEICGNASQRDYVKPTIRIIGEPITLDSSALKLTVQYADDVELGMYADGFMKPFPTALKEFSVERILYFPLYSQARELVFAVTDASGNLTRKTLTLGPPSVPVKFGSYTLTSPAQLPTDFFCGGVISNPHIATGMTLYALSEWTLSEGYKVRLDIFGNEYLVTQLVGLEPNSSIQFGSENLIFSTTPSSELISKNYQVSITPAQGSPNAVQVNIKQRCTNTSNSTITEGSPLIFTAITN